MIIDHPVFVTIKQKIFLNKIRSLILRHSKSFKIEFQIYYIYF